jgi:phosphoribosyl 1,2-cyclic phosphodiesterase
VLNVTFHGVRGSTPCCGPEVMGYGGNTSCVALESADAVPLVFDLGTGLRYFGATQPHDGSFQGVGLVTHLHWDHVQGLPFFVPLLRDGASLDIYAPTPTSGSTLCEEFARFLRPPVFPIEIANLPGQVRFHARDDACFEVDGWHITSRAVPHIGPTNGYRVERDGVTVAYLSDHQQPADGPWTVHPGALELAEGVDLLIHDAQYTPGEFAAKSNWGHCTIEYACHVAAEAGVRRLALYHHDPTHDDATLDQLAACARSWGAAKGIEVICAAERLTIALD